MSKLDEQLGTDKAKTILSNKTVFKGEMKFSKSLKIQGKFEGKIRAKGFLYIDKGAIVKGSIKAHTVIVGGTVYGNISAVNSIEMLPGGKVHGDIKAAKLKIDGNVEFKGKCEMIKDAESVDVFSADAEKIKNTIKRV